MGRFWVLPLLILILAPFAAQARDTFVMAFVPGDSGPTVAVAALDDPASPYFGKYSALDQWVMDNFSYYVNDTNYSSFQLAAPNIERALKKRGISVRVVTYKSYVELDATGEKGYLVPILAYMDSERPYGQPTTLGEMAFPAKQDLAADPRPYFWSVGIEDEAAMAQYREAVSAWLAPVYPAIPEWMVAVGHEGDQYSFLPDGGVVISVPEVIGDLSQRQAQITRYDAGGNVLKQAAGDFSDWKHLVLNDVSLDKDNPYILRKELFAESGRKLGSSNNILITGRYQTYRNAERDGFVAVIDYWLGQVFTPADGDLNQLPVDPYPYFGMTDYAEVARVYAAQQARAAAGQT